jgi:hypothetical protein
VWSLQETGSGNGVCFHFHILCRVTTKLYWLASINPPHNVPHSFQRNVEHQLPFSVVANIWALTWFHVSPRTWDAHKQSNSWPQPYFSPFAAFWREEIYLLVSFGGRIGPHLHSSSRWIVKCFQSTDLCWTIFSRPDSVPLPVTAVPPPVLFHREFSILYNGTETGRMILSPTRQNDGRAEEEGFTRYVVHNGDKSGKEKCR